MAVLDDRLLDRLKRQLRPVLIQVGALGFFINLLVLPVSLYSLQVFDRVLGTGSMATLLWLTVIMMILFAAAGMLQSMRGVILQQIGDWLHQEFQKSLIPITLMLATKNEVKGAQALRDAASLKQFIAGSGLVTLMDAPWAILFIALLFYIHFALGLLISAGALLLLLFAWTNEVLTRASLKKAGSSQVAFMQELDFATRNADVIEAMGMLETLSTRWKSKQGEINRLQAMAGGRGSMIQGTTKFFRLTLQILGTALAAYLVINHEITTGAIIAASILSSRALAPFEAAIASGKAFGEARNSYNRLQKLLTLDLRRETMSLPTPEGWLSIENVNFIASNSNQSLLKNISFQASPGEIVGIIGPSGSGKSTLSKLLGGIWQPTGGIVRLDGADVYTWPRAEFGRFTGYMPQDVELFSGTVKDNISRLIPDASPEDIVYAAQMANAHDMILRLRDGYDTNIGPNGAMLSAGQRQRIALARAFFGNPKLLILDEPDSSLDETGKQALLNALQLGKQQGMTMLVITHHKAILAHVDKLLVLNNGMVEAFGPTQKVLEAIQARQMPAQGRA